MDKKKEMVCEMDMPYERFVKLGPESLSDRELLAIILRTGSKGENALELAGHVLELAGADMGLLGLHHIDIRQLQSIKGIGIVKAVKIKCMAEVSNRISMTKAKKNICFQSPDTVADYYMEKLRHKEKEHAMFLYLDTKGHLIEEVCMTIGSARESVVCVRDVLRKALLVNATSFIMLHNHPSGDCHPSSEDRIITQKLLKASVLMDMDFLDHIIIGDKTYVSFKEQKLL